MNLSIACTTNLHTVLLIHKYLINCKELVKQDSLALRLITIKSPAKICGTFI